MRQVIAALLLAVFLAGCELAESLEGSSTPTVSTTYDRIAGFAEKGPLSQGSSVNLYELDRELNPTGKVYNTKTLSDRGDFVFTGVTLSSPYARIQAEGYYFNEVQGNLAEGRISLQGMVDLSSGGALNLNVLTHLQSDRTLALVKAGQAFGEAGKMASAEIRKAFGGEAAGSDSFEKIRLDQGDPEASWLLAVSAILVAQRTPAELSKLMSLIQADLADNGKLEDSALKVDLANGTAYLDAPAIAGNCAAFFKTQEQDFDAALLKRHLDRFDSALGTEALLKITYPRTCKFGRNLLYRDEPFVPNAPVPPDTLPALGYSLCADLPPGASLRVWMSGADWFRGLGDGNTGWEVDQPVWGGNGTFRSKGAGRIDYEIHLVVSGVTLEVEEYPKRLKSHIKIEF